MKLDMQQALSQARHLADQSVRLKNIRNSVLSYQRNLNSNWRGAEMTPTNHAIENCAQGLLSAAAEIDSISRNIVREAESIKKKEEANGY